MGRSSRDRGGVPYQGVRIPNFTRDIKKKRVYIIVFIYLSLKLMAWVEG